jgi:hypothetical protein
MELVRINPYNPTLQIILNLSMGFFDGLKLELITINRLTRKPPKTIAELHEVMEKYSRAETIFCSKTEAQRSQKRPPPRPQ